jgi:hypothetical protein
MAIPDPFVDPAPRTSGVGTLYTPALAGASTGTVVVAAGYGTFLGAHISEQGGSPAGVRFWDGASPGVGFAYEQLTTIVTVGASGSAMVWLGPQGLPVASQICLERTSGKTEIVVYGQ